MNTLLFLPEENFDLDIAVATFQSWVRVRGIKDWKVMCIIPEGSDPELDYQARMHFRNVFVYYEPSLPKGTLEPRTLDMLLKEPNSFVACANYWSVVTNDILEYFQWCDKVGRTKEGCVAVTSYVKEDYGQPEDVEFKQEFFPFVWGTWSDRWNNYVGSRWNPISEYPLNSGLSDGGINRMLKKTGNTVIGPKYGRSFPIYADLDTPRTPDITPQDYLIVKKPKLGDW